MLYRISVTERGLTGKANIFRSRLSRLDDLLGAGTVPLITLCPSVCPSVRPSVRVSWFENTNNSTTVGTRRTKFGTQVGWPGPVIVLKFQHTATDGAPSARARVRH